MVYVLYKSSELYADKVDNWHISIINLPRVVLT
jgi:hypothetical protein